MQCRFCRSPNPPTAVTCRACGVPLATPAPPPPVVSAAPEIPVAKTNGPISTPPLPAGTKLRDGLFAVGRVLRQSSLGFIYLGSDATARQPVVITELCLAGSTRDNLHLSPAPDAADAVERARHAYLDEGYLLSRLNHPSLENIVATFSENNTTYRITE